MKDRVHSSRVSADSACFRFCLHVCPLTHGFCAEDGPAVREHRAQARASWTGAAGGPRTGIERSRLTDSNGEVERFPSDGQM